MKEIQRDRERGGDKVWVRKMKREEEQVRDI